MRERERERERKIHFITILRIKLRKVKTTTINDHERSQCGTSTGPGISTLHVTQYLFSISPLMHSVRRLQPSVSAGRSLTAHKLLTCCIMRVQQRHLTSSAGESRCAVTQDGVRTNVPVTVNEGFKNLFWCILRSRYETLP